MVLAMSRKIYYLFLTSLLCCLTTAFAQESVCEDVSEKPAVYIPINIKTYEAEPQKFPVHICSIYPWGIHGKQSKNHIYNFSFSLVVGEVRAMNGFQFSGLYSQSPESFNGLQIAGLGGNSAARLKGVQIGGVTNYSVKMRGIQIAGFANAAADNGMGVQISGFVNGAANIKGVQIGGLGSAAQNVTGIQIGGISNLAQNITGLQVASVYNRIDTLRGVSIGIASFADSIEKGISLSLVNIVRQGFYREWELSFSDYANTALSYRMGTPKFYTVYTTGVSSIEDEDNRWITGVGFGNRTRIVKRFYFQPELVSLIHLPTNLKSVQNVEARLKLGFGYYINEKFGLSLAPSVYAMSDNWEIKPGLSVGLGVRSEK